MVKQLMIPFMLIGDGLRLQEIGKQCQLYVPVTLLSTHSHTGVHLFFAFLKFPDWDSRSKYIYEMLSFGSQSYSLKYITQLQITADNVSLF